MAYNVEETCKRAANARYTIGTISTETKNEVLLHAADLLVAGAEKILAANAEDLERGRRNHMKDSLLDRLMLNESRIGQIAEGLRQVAGLPDPVGEVLDEFERPNGIRIRKVRVPIGVIGIIYESRPNVTADAFALCFKSGNVSVLKGGSDAICSNQAITEILRKALKDCGVDPDAVNLIASSNREDTKRFMQMRDYIDVLIPRGSAGLIRAVVENSSIPVIETGSGNCHIYIDKDADIEKAIPIIINAKTQRTGVCNAAESLVVHRQILDRFMPAFSEAMKEHGVQLFADEDAGKFLPGSEPATEEDYAKEYLDLMMSVKCVDSIEEAIDHINRYHTKHSDCIITEDPAAAELFLELIDSACVYVNVSTRFTDGFEFGFGAEIGISTQKLHARGPMGLKELTSYKYRITGNGQVRG
ncbi:MAG: glutamate-5-semialdehyde dehydrogenase [Lachnospiraceae bacterium]|nr:glutamate-5-semialdehyde dehydrogenase [Lachnospiraceae bacterium]